MNEYEALGHADGGAAAKLFNKKGQKACVLSGQVLSLKRKEGHQPPGRSM